MLKKCNPHDITSSLCGDAYKYFGFLTAPISPIFSETRLYIQLFARKLALMRTYNQRNIDTVNGFISEFIYAEI